MNRGKLGAVTIISVLSWATGALGMYTPNPAGRWAPQRFFLAGDFQINDKDVQGGSIDSMAGFFIRPTYSVARNVVVYGMLGVQTADHLDSGFAGGFGVQGAYVFPGAREWAVGGSFGFLHWDSDFTHDCHHNICPDGKNIDWNEFQFAPAVSYQIPTLPEMTPYAGMLFDFVDARDGISESDPVGLLFGTNVDPNRHLRLDGQFRVISETGFFFSVGYLF